MSDAYLVRRGGSGGLSANAAVLHVKAPAGSTISFAKGGVVAKVLGPDKSHVNSADSSFADWYYSVTPGNFGSWTVTGANSEGSISQTVTVNAVKQYDVTTSFGRLYWQGNEYGGVTGGWGAAQAYYDDGYSYKQLAITKNSGNIVLTSQYPNGTEGCLGTANKVELTRYKTLKVNVTAVSTPAYCIPRIIVSTANIGRVSAAATVQVSAKGVASLNISSLSGKYYVLFCLNYTANNTCSMTFDKIWLET